MLPAYRDRPPHFQPSSTSDLGDFGILGLSKAERRDRKRRRAARLAKRREKLEAKGKGESRRAKRLTRRTKRLRGKAEELDVKVREKLGKKPRAKKGKKHPVVERSEVMLEQAGLTDDFDVAADEWDEGMEPAGGPNMALIVGAVAVAGIVGWMVLRK